MARSLLVGKSYLVKLLLWMLALVLVLEFVSYLTTRQAIRAAVTDNARNELQRGGEVFASLMASRAEQLALSVGVLTDDFGFKEAVASGDDATIESALVNHAARINADIAIVTDTAGELVATTMALQDGGKPLLTALHKSAAQAGTAYATLIINNKPYQFVVSPVRAPLRIGTAGIGFEIEDSLSESLKRMTGLDVSFIRLGEPRLGQSSAQYLSGTLNAVDREILLSLLDQPDGQTPQAVLENNGMMLLRVPVADQPYRLEAVLQVPLSQVLQPFAALDNQLFWLALLFSAFAALLAWLLARGVTQPLRTLADAARRIASGHYDTPVAVNSRDEMGELAQGFISMQSAIAEREQEITWQARHDGLTRLLNRAQLFPRLQVAIEQARHSGTSVAVLIIDVENFTQINDALSPEIGDLVLCEVAQRIASLAASADCALRLGSDEFALVASAADSARKTALTRQLKAAFAAPVSVEELNINVNINVGLVTYPQDGSAPEVLLRRASLALQQARQGQQGMCEYQAGWDEQHLKRLVLFREFRQALEDEQIQLYFQPKISLHDPRSVSAEALVRWIHPQLGFVNPEEFISVAESTGQITLLTRWVLRTALRQVALLGQRNIALGMSVNLSALDLLEDDLPGYIGQLLTDFAVAPQLLCLEITESAIMREAEKSLDNLNRLQALGVTLSIDDFGTGYSSLSQLKKLPVAELKIDKSFILNLDHSENDQVIVRSTIELGHSMGLSITAEGVETAAIEALLVTYGCDTAQGYLYSKALPADDFVRWLDSYSLTLA